MSAYVDPRFRPTLWPGMVVPAPPVRPFNDVEVHGDWITWVAGPTRGRTPEHLPDDFYLRELMELPAEDLEAAAEVFRVHGRLFDLNRGDLPLGDYTDEVLAELDAIPEEDPDWPDYRGGVHRDLVRFHVETAQEAITIWLACQRPGGLEELVEPDVTPDQLASLRAQNPDSSELGSLDQLRALLIEFQLATLRSTVDAALSQFSIGLTNLAERWPSVYSVAFLQLYNHLAEGATASRCRNETCGRHFVRQRGRAAYGQHRTTGVLYCSRECARAQAQRTHRRRRKQNPPA